MAAEGQAVVVAMAAAASEGAIVEVAAAERPAAPQKPVSAKRTALEFVAARLAVEDRASERRGTGCAAAVAVEAAAAVLGSGLSSAVLARDSYASGGYDAKLRFPIHNLFGKLKLKI